MQHGWDRPDESGKSPGISQCLVSGHPCNNNQHYGYIIAEQCKYIDLKKIFVLHLMCFFCQVCDSAL